MRTTPVFFALCTMGALLSLALPRTVAAAAGNQTAPQQAAASSGVATSPASAKAAVEPRNATSAAAPPSFAGSGQVDFSAATTTELLEFAPLVPPRTGWVSMESGARPAYVGIHGGTAHVSLLRASNGVLFAFTGQTGNDFMHVLRRGDQKQTSPEKPADPATPANATAAREEGESGEETAQNATAGEAQSPVPEGSLPEKAAQAAAPSQESPSSPAPERPAGAEAASGNATGTSLVAANQPAAPAPQGMTEASAQGGTAHLPASAEPKAAPAGGATARNASAERTAAGEKHLVEPVPDTPGATHGRNGAAAEPAGDRQTAESSPKVSPHDRESASAEKQKPPQQKAAEPEKTAQAGQQRTAAVTGGNATHPEDPVAAIMAQLPPDHPSLIFASGELAKSITNSADAFAPFGLSVPEDIAPEPVTAAPPPPVAQKAPRQPAYKPLKLRSYQSVLQGQDAQ